MCFKIFSTQDNEATTTEEIHSEDLCDTMTLAQAKEIAKMSEECQSAGVFQFENTEMNFCNNHTHTWQFILTNVTEPLCGAACYVHTKTSKAELQWMCTGALIEEE